MSILSELCAMNPFVCGVLIFCVGLIVLAFIIAATWGEDDEE